MQQILLVDASPRRGGNSEIIIETLAGYIHECLPDAHIDIFKIREHSLEYCLACDACQGKDDQMCVQGDDMTALLPTIENADAVVLASPIYNQMLAAQAVTFIDRFYPFYKYGDPMYSNSKKRNKKACVIAVSWGDSPDYAALAEDTVRGFCQIGANAFQSYAFGGIKEPGDIVHYPAYFEKLKELAGWICG